MKPKLKKLIKEVYTGIIAGVILNTLVFGLISFLLKDYEIIKFVITFNLGIMCASFFFFMFIIKELREVEL